MNTTIKFLKINISLDYLNKNNILLLDFFKSKNIRNNIINHLLDDSLSFKGFNILNIIYTNDIFIIDLKVEIFCTSIIKFDCLQNALSFCLYIKNNDLEESSLSLYLLNNFFYLIIENQNSYNIKLSDFETIKYSPLIYSTITENGFKLST